MVRSYGLWGPPPHPRHAALCDELADAKLTAEAVLAAFERARERADEAYREAVPHIDPGIDYEARGRIVGAEPLRGVLRQAWGEMYPNATTFDAIHAAEVMDTMCQYRAMAMGVDTLACQWRTYARRKSDVLLDPVLLTCLGCLTMGLGGQEGLDAELDRWEQEVYGRQAAWRLTAGPRTRRHPEYDPASWEHVRDDVVASVGLQAWNETRVRRGYDEDRAAWEEGAEAAGDAGGHVHMPLDDPGMSTFMRRAARALLWIEAVRPDWPLVLRGGVLHPPEMARLSLADGMCDTLGYTPEHPESAHGLSWLAQLSAVRGGMRTLPPWWVDGYADAAAWVRERGLAEPEAEAKAEVDA